MILIPQITIPQKRYDELVAKEERLRLLEESLRNKEKYSSVEDVKEIFGLNKKETEKENEE